jgi:DNA primase
LYDKFFINHSDTEVSKLASNLCASKHELSKIHRKKGNLKPIEKIIGELIPKVVLELKWKMVKVKSSDCALKLKNAEESGNQEDIPALIQEKIILQNAFKIISEQLGRAIV